MTKFTKIDIRALIDALVAWEKVKPGQVGKRVVFEKYGIRGTVKDYVFTAVIYKLERRRGLIDRVLSSAGINVETLDPYSRALLRLVVYEKLFGKGSSRLLKSLLKYGPLAVEKLTSLDGKAAELKGIVERLNSITYAPSNLIEELEFKFLAPYGFIKRVVDLLGFKDAELFFKAVDEIRHLSFRVNTLKVTVEDVIRLLESEGYKVARSSLVPSVIKLRGPFDYANSEVFKRGYIVPQDEASALASLLLDPKPGEVVVDLCAAPGGKTTHIGELMRNRGKILAVELYEDRARRLENMLKKCGVTIAQVIVMDAREAPYVFGDEIADKVLLDPPCSSSGALVKSPEARWRFNEAELSKLVHKQRELLASAIKLVKPGGYVLYTTCSVFKEENEDNIAWLLENYSNCLKVSELRYPGVDAGFLPGTLRTWPHRHGTSGFFYALIQKVSSCK